MCVRTPHVQQLLAPVITFFATASQLLVCVGGWQAVWYGPLWCADTRLTCVCYEQRSRQHFLRCRRGSDARSIPVLPRARALHGTRCGASQRPPTHARGDAGAISVGRAQVPRAQPLFQQHLERVGVQLSQQRFPRHGGHHWAGVRCRAAWRQASGATVCGPGRSHRDCLHGTGSHPPPFGESLGAYSLLAPTADCHAPHAHCCGAVRSGSRGRRVTRASQNCLWKPAPTFTSSIRSGCQPRTTPWQPATRPPGRCCWPRGSSLSTATAWARLAGGTALPAAMAATATQQEWVRRRRWWETRR